MADTTTDSAEKLPEDATYLCAWSLVKPKEWLTVDWDDPKDPRDDVDLWNNDLKCHLRDLVPLAFSNRLNHMNEPQRELVYQILNGFRRFRSRKRAGEYHIIAGLITTNPKIITRSPFLPPADELATRIPLIRTIRSRRQAASPDVLKFKDISRAQAKGDLKDAQARRPGFANRYLHATKRTLADQCVISSYPRPDNCHILPWIMTATPQLVNLINRAKTTFSEFFPDLDLTGILYTSLASYDTVANILPLNVEVRRL
ncbi:hypothetical protein JDV02_006933 [Purpureocillium takamizusanense]|uniref:Uncharacterized protein n=1 Tax=Purpureocillium takamizusanense TaxID=2060973 RepID=A0A9Q8VDG9_9HYPO|nr:uncharacterized protein JDV02_006933 [Purpureocillium takamizusanense]UNI20884.1 hypothetical protein JDV02_006933 [Purpureocillium takamizusanense]